MSPSGKNCLHSRRRFSSKHELVVIYFYIFYSSEKMTMKLCTVEYSSSPEETEASLVEIDFSEQCRSQMMSFFQCQMMKMITFVIIIE